jgi:hypothetical protein
MATAPLSLSTQLAADRHSKTEQRRERWFFSGMTIAMALTCFVGFAPSYFLRSHFGPPQALPALLHLHGLAFSLWIVLLVAQSTLIAVKRTRLHRYLGYAGAILAMLMMVLGGIVAVTRAKQGLLGQGTGVPPLVFLAIPLATLVVFPVMIGAALYFRRRVDTHKRLILLGTVELLSAAVGRMPAIAAVHQFAFFAVTDLFVLAIVAYDLATRRRLHPATLWGGLFVVASQPLRIMVAMSPAWMEFAQWVTG